MYMFLKNDWIKKPLAFWLAGTILALITRKTEVCCVVTCVLKCFWTEFGAEFSSDSIRSDGNAYLNLLFLTVLSGLKSQTVTVTG